ncbi:MAG: TraR/DksA family transcriptional regulator [Bdellovibrionota bacterium]
MKLTEIQAIKDSLIYQKSMILNKRSGFSKDHLEGERLSDEVDVVTHNMQTEISIHLHERERLALLQIEKALGKISEGTYGYCDTCGDLITAKRLQVYPLTCFCLACQEELEDQRKSRNLQ